MWVLTVVSSSGDTWLGSLVCNVDPSPLGVRESDVQSSEGLHQGDLRVHVRFTSAPVSAAISVLQGFEAVPLLLTLLLLQPLLFPPLLVCDLWELVLRHFAFFTRAGPSLAVLHPAFTSALTARESGAAAWLLTRRAALLPSVTRLKALLCIFQRKALC